MIFIHFFEFIQLLVEKSSQNWIIVALNSCVNEENVLEISSLFCDIEMMLAKNTDRSLVDSRIIPDLKTMLSRNRIELRRLECSLLEI